MSGDSVLVIKDLTSILGGRVVLDGLSLELKAGEILALAGPSGSGKTSVVRTLLGLLPADRGTVRIAGQVASEGPKAVLRPEERNLAVVFQDLALWPHLSVRGNLAFGLDARKVPKAEQDERIASILRRVGLDGMEARHLGELSGGERQRVAIARALVLDPWSVLLDEPLSNLDVALKRELLALFRELITERHVSALYVTHDPCEATSLGSRLARIDLLACPCGGRRRIVAFVSDRERVGELLERLGAKIHARPGPIPTPVSRSPDRPRPRPPRLRVPSGQRPLPFATNLA